MPQRQSGFRTWYSCAAALSDVDRGSCVVLLDYTKAFDMINHNVLLSIMRFVGFSN